MSSKKLRTCGFCKERGYHDKRTCPNKSNNNITNTLGAVFSIATIAYISNYSIDSLADIIDMQQSRIKNKKKRLEFKLKENGKVPELWFDTQQETINTLHKELFKKKKNIAVVVAEPGVGKTNLIHGLYYYLKVILPENDIILDDRITICTGMSSRDWIEQTAENTQLRDTETINGSGDSDIKEDIYHNPTFTKRIDFLKKHPELLSNHIFIIDECHIAVEKGNTIDKHIESLGLDSVQIKRLNIKFILISATPDIVTAELVTKIEKDWKFVKLEQGGDYKGFKYFTEKKMIQDYDKIIKNLNKPDKINEFIEGNFSEPKIHILRLKGKTGDKLKTNIMELCKKNPGKYKYKEHNQQDTIENFQVFISTQPEKHTFIFIKDYFRASYRIRLNGNFGLILEPATKISDVTVTAQGLIARFFGYYSNEEMLLNKHIFICNIECVKTYNKFTETFSYEGTDYKSRRLKKGGIPKKGKSTYIKDFTEDKPEDEIIRKTYDCFPRFDEEPITDIEVLKEKFKSKYPDKDFTENHIHSPDFKRKGDKVNYWCSSKINNWEKITLEKLESSLQSNTNFDGSKMALIYPVYLNEDDAPELVRFYMKYIIE